MFDDDARKFVAVDVLPFNRHFPTFEDHRVRFLVVFGLQPFQLEQSRALVVGGQDADIRCGDEAVRAAFALGLDVPVVSTSALLDVHGAADRLGVTDRFIRRLVEERRIPFHKIGRLVRFDPIEVDRWIDTCRVEPRRGR